MPDLIRHPVITGSRLFAGTTSGFRLSPEFEESAERSEANDCIELYYCRSYNRVTKSVVRAFLTVRHGNAGEYRKYNLFNTEGMLFLIPEARLERSEGSYWGSAAFSTRLRPRVFVADRALSAAAMNSCASALPSQTTRHWLTVTGREWSLTAISFSPMVSRIR
jgi:hypothetical protein